MQLLVIRHAIAEDRSEAARQGLPDDQRRLTSKGRSRMRRGARGLAKLVGHADLAATSPLVRAVETTRIVAAAFGEPPVVQVDSLRPGGDRDEFREWLCSTHQRVVAVVGHEPDLGLLVGWLLTGRDDVALPLRKGGACLIDFKDPPAPGAASLRWFLAPSLLRRIAS